MITAMISASKLTAIVISLGIITFLSLGFLGMNMSMDGQMSNCPFMDNAALCNMTPFEHIAAVQNLFTALPQTKDASLILSLLLLVIGSLIVFFQKAFAPPDTALAYHRISTIERWRSPNFLQEAFSNGILNPKLF